MAGETTKLDAQFRRWERRLPPWMARHVRWLRQPSSRWVRIPAAVLLIGGGFIGFLPVLGFWMIPLGLMLVAQDVPLLRGPMARFMRWLDERWLAARKWRRRRPRDVS